MQVYAWIESQLLIFMIRLQKCFILPETNSTTPKIKYEETRCVTPRQTSTPKSKPKVPTQHDNRDLSNVDYVPSALDWLFERINLDPKIQIKYVDTTHQFADTLTKGNFTCDEWNNLLHLFNISHFSLLCCSLNFSLTSCTETTAKRMQEQEGENRIVAESKPTTMNLAFTVSTSSSTVQNPVTSKSPGILKAPCRTDWSSTGKLDAEEHNQDAASSSQGWQKDAVLDEGTRKLVATEEDQGHLNYPEDSVSTRKLVASGNSETEGSDKGWPHSLLISTNYVLHMEKVFFLDHETYDGSNE